jgi:Flp pilus assembly pilin Flp
MEEDMKLFINYVLSLVRRDEGQDLVEYAMLVALIALIAVGAVSAAGVRVDAIFDAIVDQIPVPGGN